VGFYPFRLLASLARAQAQVGWRRRPRRCSALAGATVLGMLLGACGGQVVASHALGYYLRLPSGWKVYSKSQMLRTAKFAALLANPPQVVLGASDAPHPDASQTFSASKYPWALLVVTGLGSSQQESLTLAGLQDVLVNVDQLSQQGVAVQELAQPSLVVHGSLRGTKVVFEVGSGANAIDYEQETWVNSPTDRLWVLMVGCSPQCYQQQSSVLNSVLQSFYVR
jgi:hypothetical protein